MPSVVQSTYANAGIVEHVEWDDSANVDERSAVEQEIDDVREHRIFSRLVEETTERSQ